MARRALRTVLVLAWGVVASGWPAASLFAQPAPVSAVAPSASLDEWTYAVRPGDSLWALSREYLRSVAHWRRLQIRNRVADPMRLAPGTRLRIPFDWMKVRPAPARVVDVRPGTLLLRGAAGPTALEAGAEIQPGDVLTTAGDGSAMVEFADGSRLLVGPNARVVFDVLSAFGATGMVDTRVRLERGRTRAQVTPRRGRFRIWTPAAATVVRGTEFRAEFDAGQRVAYTEVLTGTVEASAADQAVAIGPGFGTAAAEGQPPATPSPLLPPPDLGREPRRVERLPLRIAVPPIAGAVAYHLEVAPDDRFLSLAFEGTSPTTEFRAGSLPDGTYRIRMRGVDAVGLQGLDATATLELDARPEPPVLIEPGAGAVLAAARPTFRWSRPAGATGYRVQVSLEGQTGSLVDETRAGDPAFTPDRDLDGGRYTWRVATRAGEDQGPFGDWQAFTRRPPLPGPQAAPPQADAGRVRLAWSQGPAASTYRLQVARDAAFADLVVDETLHEPAFTLTSPPAGTYHLRVKTIEADGYEGDFGTPQSFEVVAPPARRRFPWRWILVPAVPAIVILVTS